MPGSGLSAGLCGRSELPSAAAWASSRYGVGSTGGAEFGSVLVTQPFLTQKEATGNNRKDRSKGMCMYVLTLLYMKYEIFQVKLSNLMKFGRVSPKHRLRHPIINEETSCRRK